MALFLPEEAFERGERLQAVRVAAESGVTRVVFSDLVPGDYCLAASYDADGNGKLTRNLFGIPKEPYGFSRDARTFRSAVLRRHFVSSCGPAATP